MKKRVVVLPAADRDLEDQAAYLSEAAGTDVALRFFESAASTFSFLTQTPEAGALRASELPSLAGLRLWRIKGFELHLIFYRVTDDSIEIVRLLHAHRDIAAIFESW